MAEELEIQITGREDREGPWKVAVAGYPGAAKTLLASTCEPGENLFVWFVDSPIKSVADRFLPHVKLGNKIRSDGSVESTVQDQLHVLVSNLQMKAMLGENKYKAITVDTGDQLFQQMASARRAKNRGEFGPGDWTWLADAYRSVMQTLIDLPMHVIVLFHLTASQDGQDGFMVRELALQGAAKNEASSWFDVVGALDTFETLDQDGDAVVQRVLLTHSSRMYPWVKDHSGNMPARFPLSSNFVGDWDRLLKTFMASERWGEGQERQVIDTIGAERVVSNSGAAVPTPEELQAKKTLKPRGKTTETEAPDLPVEVAAEVEAPVLEPTQGTQEVLDVVEPPTASTPEESESHPEPDSTDSGPEPTMDQTLEILAEGGITAEFVCEVCSASVDDEDLREVTKIRFPDKVYCREHFKAALDNARKG
jgi:hypothetical protein